MMAVNRIEEDRMGENRMTENRNYIISIDQSTQGTKVGLYDQNFRRVRTLHKSHRQYYPAQGQVEHDAEEIWQNLKSMLAEIAAEVSARVQNQENLRQAGNQENLRQAGNQEDLQRAADGENTSGSHISHILGLAIANQRETTVIWDKATGQPVYHAIVWQDVRAGYITGPLADKKEEIFQLTGLIPSPYYSAAKAAAVLAENPDLAQRAAKGELAMGTMDAYLLYRLTDGASFATDLTNAARTQLLDIRTGKWSSRLAGYFKIPESMLPEQVLPSDSDFGEITAIPELKGVHVCTMMGDTNGSLFGHGIFQKGMVKTSYGTGSSIMMNIGEEVQISENGLSTSIGIAAGGKVIYVLEGNITHSADTLNWVKDGMQLIRDYSELDLAGEVDSTEGVYLVPAFSGLGAPWFNEGARALLCGMSRGTTKAHILRAALASIAHQNADVLDAMEKDTGITVQKIQADGGGSVNPLLMQMQSDYVPCETAVSAEKELTLSGAARMAGLTLGLYTKEQTNAKFSAIYQPGMQEEERRKEREGWLHAVEKAREE